MRPTDGGQVLALDAGTIDALVSGCGGLLDEAERSGDLAGAGLLAAGARGCWPGWSARCCRGSRSSPTGEVSRTAQIESLGVVSGAVAIR